MHDSKICLYCLKNLPADTREGFHAACSRKFFGSAHPPVLPYSLEQLSTLARDIVQRSVAVTGVQPKLSLSFDKNVNAGTYRLTLVGLWGDYILKPLNTQFPELVENEHLSMSLARAFGIETVPFSFILLQSGERAYLTKRIDRHKGAKLAMEDFCQLSERLTEYKYRGSVEQCAKIIQRFSSNPGLDLTNFTELTLFNFLIGNADMHLKNYSLLTNSAGETRLAPAYDLVATRLVMPADPEESALTINGKKNRLTAADFSVFAANIGLNKIVFDRINRRFQQKLPEALNTIKAALLTEQSKVAYAALLSERAARLFPNNSTPSHP